MNKQFKWAILFLSALFSSMILVGCGDKEKVVITNIKQLNDKEFGIPTGTVADKLVLSVFPNAKFQYFNINICNFVRYINSFKMLIFHLKYM